MKLRITVSLIGVKILGDIVLMSIRPVALKLNLEGIFWPNHVLFFPKIIKNQDHHERITENALYFAS